MADDGQRLAGASLLVLANKQDVEGAMGAGEIREALGLEGIESHRWKIWACSGIRGDNLAAGLDWLVNDIGARVYYFASSSRI